MWLVASMLHHDDRLLLITCAFGQSKLFVCNVKPSQVIPWRSTSNTPSTCFPPEIDVLIIANSVMSTNSKSAR